MACRAIAEIARESDVLIIGSAQSIRIRQVITAVNTVDLCCEADALFRRTVGQRRIMADHAFLSVPACTAVDEAQVLMAGAALVQ